MLVTKLIASSLKPDYEEKLFAAPLIMFTEPLHRTCLLECEGGRVDALLPEPGDVGVEAHVGVPGRVPDGVVRHVVVGVVPDDVPLRHLQRGAVTRGLDTWPGLDTRPVPDTLLLTMRMRDSLFLATSAGSSVCRLSELMKKVARTPT